jgi:hypothetical protein
VLVLHPSLCLMLILPTGPRYSPPLLPKGKGSTGGEGDRAATRPLHWIEQSLFLL